MGVVKKLESYILKKDFLLAFFISLATASLGIFFGWYNNKVVPINPVASARYVLQPTNKLSFLSNWDGPNYIHLATHGYTSVAYANFFPLYPLIVHAVNKVLDNPLMSALVVSWVCFIFAVYFYIKIAKLIFKNVDNKESIRALLLFTFYPTAIFLFVTYTEGLLAALSLGAIYFAIKRRFYLAAVFAGFASATHLTGEFVVLLIMMMSWEHRHSIIRFLSVGVIGSLGLASYSYYLHEKFARPLAFVTSQENHGWVKSTYANLFGSIGPLNIAFICLLILAAFYWWGRKRSFAIYSLLFLLIPIIGKEFGGFDRYTLMAFPIPLMLYGYSRKRPVFYSIVLAASVVVWSYLMLQYAGGYVGG
ncbi:MAG TPA: mannosyltransferase family protein [Candidatus Sulfotelmatobacter sp.]|nr:mannosyltransferase family protein [Candidatus Sulfotelmatobacter sp.]